jgi:mannan endo-1,6-alpha-mannosidase
MLFLGVYCQSINLQNTGSVQAGAAKITANALAYYTTSPGSDGMGAVRPNTRQDAQGIQWYESGIYWGAVLEYSRVFKDEKFINIAGTALGLASYGKTGSFLGSNALVAATLMGRWNDDIAWWGLATVTGAEIFGKDAKMPNGQTYLFVSENTYKQVWEQWDTTTCEGGIYWSRDRVTQDKRQGYKSAITNAQMIMLAARLYLLTNNPTYITQANQVYTWMRRGLISRDWIVYDGLDANQRCGMNIDKQSYKAGTMIGALAWMFKATGNESYLRDAGNMLTTAIREFSKDGMLADQCEPNCAKNAVQAKGTYIRGLGYLAALTTIQADRDRIRTHLTTAMQGMLKTCDANLQCGTNWLVGQREVSDFHKQTNAMELISAYTMAMAGSLSNAKFSAPKAKDDESSAGSLSVAAAISAALLL